jgi:hypothetical protein
VESRNGSIVVDSILAQNLTGGTHLDSDLVLRSGDFMSVLSDLAANSLELHANADPLMDAGLIVGTALSADEITLHAGNAGQTAARVLITSAGKLLGRDGTSAPHAVTIRQDASIDGVTGLVPDQSALGTVSGPMLYSFDSDGGDILISDAAGTAAGLRNDQFVVVLEAAGDVTIESDMNARAISAHSGTDGAGDVLVGVSRGSIAGEFIENSTQPRIDADAGFIAGNETDGGAAQVRIGDQVVFGAPVPSAYVFSLAQDADITDEHIPMLSQFEAAPGDIGYTLQSNGGRVNVNTAAKVAGTHLTLRGSTITNGVIVDVNETLRVASLHLSRTGIIGSEAVLAQSVFADDGDIVSDTPIIFRGAADPGGGVIPPAETRSLIATAGNISVGDVHYVRRPGFGAGDQLLIGATGDVTVDGSIEFESATDDAAVTI